MYCRISWYMEEVNYAIFAARVAVEKNVGIWLNSAFGSDVFVPSSS